MGLRGDPRTYAIIGAAMEVHRELGCGFLEAVYQEALAVELTCRQVPFEREVELPIRYKGQVLRTSYRVDFLCYGSVLVELKALTNMGGTEEAQHLWLPPSGSSVAGLLLNFGTKSLEYRRFKLGTHSPSGRSVQSA